MMAPARAAAGRRRGVLPGFGLSTGFTVLYLCLVVLVPLSTLAFRSAALSWGDAWRVIASPRALASYRLSFGTSLAAAGVNVIFGVLVAWVLARYRFPGRSLVDAVVDLPFALPTAVSGIALTAVYARNGWIGRWLEPLGIKATFSALGVTLALTFIGLPFVIRTVQPVLEDLDAELEEAAAVLGAGRWQTFRRVLFPAILPAALTGFALAFARALGEYGSVVFISGNMPMRHRGGKGIHVSIETDLHGACRLSKTIYRRAAGQIPCSPVVRRADRHGCRPPASGSR